ncbi:MAG: redoxin domain-containing protein [Candidatus Eisenbacteria bacterium]
MDFTFVCPTEIAEFGRRTEEFGRHNARVLGVSTDTWFTWRGGDGFPMPLT